MPTSPPAGWYPDPKGSGGQRYWDAERWTTRRRPDRTAGWAAGARRRWVGLPALARVAIPAVLILALVGLGLAFWTKSPQDDWAGLPARLSCRTQDGPKPPNGITVSSVEARHPRGSVLALVVQFAQPLPPSPSGKHATGFAGYVLTYRVANGGKTFVELGPEEGTNDLAITGGSPENGDDARMRPDRDTNARRIAPDTVQIMLDLKRLGVETDSPVRPQLTLESQFNTPSTTTVRFATQVCGG